VKLAEVKVVFSVGALMFEGDLSASIFHLQLIVDQLETPPNCKLYPRHCAANYMSETWTSASALGGSYLGSGYSKQLDCDLEHDLAAGMSRYFTG
jgi:hypothetical protein